MERCPEFTARLLCVLLRQYHSYRGRNRGGAARSRSVLGFDTAEKNRLLNPQGFTSINSVQALRWKNTACSTSASPSWLETKCER
jgi:hypothetical protein